MDEYKAAELGAPGVIEPEPQIDEAPEVSKLFDNQEYMQIPASPEIMDSVDSEVPAIRSRAGRRRKSETPFYIAVGSMGAMILILIIFSVFGTRAETSVPTAKPENTTAPVAEPSAVVDETPMLSTGIVNENGDEVVIPDIYDGLDLNSLDSDKFSKTANGFLYYTDASVTSYAGIDVSEHQFSIDWAAVAASGVDFAMIRVGYRGYTEGTVALDPYFTENIEGALAAGIKVGVYFFSQARNTEEALEEADFVLSAIEGYDITYPVAFDWEEIISETARTNDVTPEELTDCAIAFCDRIAMAGYMPLIYFNQMAGYMQFTLTDLNHYDFWLAEYNSTPNFLFSFHMWQYSSTGTVDGIETAVDLNISFVDYSQEKNQDDGEISPN